MRRTFFALLFHAALLSAAAASTTATLDVRPAVVSDDEDFVAKRLLRTAALTSEDDEEDRAFPTFGLEKSPTKVFSLLELDKAGANLFMKSRWKTWVTYVNKFEKMDPEQAMVSVLAKHYDDDVLSGMLAAAKMNSKTSSIANNLEAGLVKKWIASGQSPDEVFKLLQLHKAGDNLIASPQLITWTSYMKHFNREFPEDSTTLLKTLMNHYGDGQLARIVQRASLVDGSKKMADEVQILQFGRWVNENKSTGDVIDLLISSRTASGVTNSQRTTKLEQGIINKYDKFVGAFTLADAH
ncbi:hypothetical protein Pcac1_g15763 [Phytophthora cactorum]|uniref:RxLR effector PexRD54 WY domain-containing protein n=3 Tax=Phytophthora cactorum TaxID=29920 RepID=A0A8T1BQ89_9STRA|nr:hypothetical protein Pcac1_g15763 [Phytophthora cactorum]KAG2893155.1 hypothetical protein PC114_g16356 [Phytophthora cactorum]KAG2906609.1 hypothetical protein PC115_g14238 [Phytophthora cactorum]KAG2923495.1 hypothetical protein PC117_g15729 [Phytophthora cactorum]KAG3003661.1 hypothetical protein PC119_g15888 [Phytophthora cactorum]